jgi:hypothetical protein
LGWCFYSTLDDDYASSADVVWNGSRSVVIGNEPGTVDSPLPALRINALWQGVDAAAFRGKRVEISAQVRTTGAALLAVSTATTTDLTEGHESLRTLPATHQFAPPSAAANWTRLSVITDIPDDADVLYYFVSHNGGARLWVDDVHVIETGPDSPVTESAQTIGTFSVTGMDTNSRLPAPANLDFESTNRTQRDGPAGAPSSACRSIRIG